MLDAKMISYSVGGVGYVSILVVMISSGGDGFNSLRGIN
jgi:hypothetical protein